MNPAFLGSRLFTSEMPRFLHKIGQNYKGNGLTLDPSANIVWTPGLYLKFITVELCLTNTFQ